MPYRPHFDRGHFWTPFAALIPAAGYAAIFVTLSLLPFFLFDPILDSDGPFGRQTPSLSDLGSLAIMLVVMLLGMATAAFVTVGLILLLVGVPVAWIIGRHMSHPLSHVPALLAALITSWLLFGFSPAGQPFALALALWCALGSALIYRHFVIRFRDENDLSD